MKGLDEHQRGWRTKTEGSVVRMRLDSGQAESTRTLEYLLWFQNQEEGFQQ